MTVQALQERLKELEERLLKAEVTLETLSTGQSLMAEALETGGLMESGEPVKPSWDPDKIKWVQVEGSRGPYERYPGEDQKAEATDDYKNMLVDLKRHNGRMTRNGYFFWAFADGATVGRKLRKVKEPRSKPVITPQDVKWGKLHEIKDTYGNIIGTLGINPNRAKLSVNVPVNINTGPLGWLFGTLQRYTEAHPDFKFSIDEDEGGILRGVDFHCSIKNEGELLAWLSWALRHALEKPAGS